MAALPARIFTLHHQKNNPRPAIKITPLPCRFSWRRSGDGYNLHRGISTRSLPVWKQSAHFDRPAAFCCAPHNASPLYL